MCFVCVFLNFIFVFIYHSIFFYLPFNVWYLNLSFNYYCLVALVSCHRLLAAHRHLLVCLTSIMLSCLLTVAWWVLNPCMSLRLVYPTQLSHRRMPRELRCCWWIGGENEKRKMMSNRQNRSQCNRIWNAFPADSVHMLHFDSN